MWTCDERVGKTVIEEVVEVEIVEVSEVVIEAGMGEVVETV